MHKLKCKLCDKEFIKRPRIGGKRLLRTKYCLKCIPPHATKEDLSKVPGYYRKDTGIKFTCLKCGKDYPIYSTVSVGNESIRIHRKKYCLNCISHKVNVNKKFNKRGKQIVCKICGKKFIFGKKPNTQNSKICNRCVNQKHALKTKLKAIKYKGGKCRKCGYDRNIAAMVFHHYNPKKKDVSFGQFRMKTWSKLKKELDKCWLLCANCHAEIHNPQDKIYVRLVQSIADDV